MSVRSTALRVYACPLFVLLSQILTFENERVFPCQVEKPFRLSGLKKTPK